MREWVSNRWATRVPAGGLAPLLSSVAPLLCPATLTKSAANLKPRTRYALLWEALQLTSTALLADTPRVETDTDAAVAAGTAPPSVNKLYISISTSISISISISVSQYLYISTALLVNP